MLDTVKINHVQHISFTQSRLTDAVSVILSELLSYEHPSKGGGFLFPFSKETEGFHAWRGGEAAPLALHGAKGAFFHVRERPL